MRKVLLIPLLLWACGGDKAPPADDAAMAAPAALTAADVVGNFAGQTMVEGNDTLVYSWTSVTMTNAEGALVGEFVQEAAPDMIVPMVAEISGDSAIWVGGPYTPIGAAAGAAQMTWTAVGRPTDSGWVGTVTWTNVGSDSVVQRGTWTATLTP